MAHHRLFVAIRPAAPVRARLLSLAVGIPGARWQSDDQIHCTLRFIGEVDHHRAQDIAALLGHVRHPAMTLTLGEIGSFERGSRIDTLWIGVQPREPLKALHDKIDRVLRQTGVPPDPRVFLPHITLARFGRRVFPPRDIANRIASPPSEAFTAAALDLCESHLGSEGAVYDMVARFPLASSED